MLMRFPMGSRRPNNSSESFSLITATRLLAWSSTRVNERPGKTSPPLTASHWRPRPITLTDSRLRSSNSMPRLASSLTTTKAMVGSAAMRSASAKVSGDFLRRSRRASFEIWIPPWKLRNTKNVRGPSCSTMSVTPRLMPVIMAAMTITTATPMATPRMVRAARALLALMELRAIPTPSKTCIATPASSHGRGSILAAPVGRV